MQRERFKPGPGQRQIARHQILRDAFALQPNIRFDSSAGAGARAGNTGVPAGVRRADDDDARNEQADYGDCHPAEAARSAPL